MVIPEFPAPPVISQAEQQRRALQEIEALESQTSVLRLAPLVHLDD